ncbi:HAMP domain-containing histidine kinase [bacterium]|nr:MAG: HAMP domain-containing histidine kinase [bacterium]
MTRFTGDAAEATKYLESVHRSGKHLLEVVDQVLEMSKAESGTMSLRAEVLEVSAVLTRVMATVAPIAERNGIRLEVAHAPGLTLEADPVKLAQVLINLTSNAIKFSPAGSLVEVSVTEERDAIRFVVCDQGIGIAREHHSIVFESFRQVEGGHTRRFGGTGLGLAIARKLVELHDGEIWLESAPGRGTTFFVRLPRKRASAESSGAFVVAPGAAADPRGLQGGIDYGGARS